jgi:hypothetical protein
MKTVTTIMDIRTVVQSGIKEVAERLRYLTESKQDIALTISQKAGQPLVIEINEAKPEGVVEEKKPEVKAKLK